MKLVEVLSEIQQPRNVNTLIHVLLGKGDSLSMSDVENQQTLENVEKQLAETKQQQDDCKSDQEYWGYEGQLAYLRCIRDLLKASEITGLDNLPDVDIPDLKKYVFMDACGKLEDFGSKVLKLAQGQI